MIKGGRRRRRKKNGKILFIVMGEERRGLQCRLNPELSVTSENYLEFILAGLNNGKCWNNNNISFHHRCAIPRR